MKYMLGCNYWASNAGTEMWNNWDENAVESDFKRLSEYGIEYLRVFPNWRDFQPVCGTYTAWNRLIEYRDKNDNLFDNPYYIDWKMMERFERFCELAIKYNLKLIVGLLTGWMSGRLFVPPYLEQLNLFVDPSAIELEQKFIKGFVSHFCENEAIYAWDLGNECNSLSKSEKRVEAAAWTATVSNAIRAFDKTNKPIVSGMHSLKISGTWTIRDQAENTDILTTHPYPFFVEHCFKDHMLSYRTLLHATCESIYYSTIGNKPCLVEEIGTLGPCTCDDETAAAFLRTNLYSNWANGLLGVMWWCANEQIALKTPPYTWTMMERELGLFDRDGNPRKTLLEYKAFSSFLKEFGAELPPVKYDAVCIMTGMTEHGQDHWGTGYMTYLIAKQAGLNMSFSSFDNDIPYSDVYLMPSICSDWIMGTEKFDELLERVYNGATLYISNYDGFIAEFEKITGVHIKNASMEDESSSMVFDGETIEFSRTKKYYIESEYAIAYEKNGAPVFTKHKYGKGIVYYLNFPLERMLLDKNYIDKGNYYKIYKEIFKNSLMNHIVNIDNKYVGLTIHENEDDCYAVLINYSNEKQNVDMKIKIGYEIERVIKGNVGFIEPNDATIVKIKKV